MLQRRKINTTKNTTYTTLWAQTVRDKINLENYTTLNNTLIGSKYVRDFRTWIQAGRSKIILNQTSDGQTEISFHFAQCQTKLKTISLAEQNSLNSTTKLKLCGFSNSNMNLW